MKSKELNEILNKTRRTKDISLSVEQIEELVKDLGELESYRKVMCRPVRDLMDDLERLKKQDKILEILKPYTELKYDDVNDEYNLIIDASERIPLSEDYDINRCILGIAEYEVMPIKEWLDGKD